MKLTTKARYGLRALIDLAVHADDGVVALSQVADRQDISMSYLEQLIARLRKADIVIGVRGAQGGYKLSRRADEISVGEILRALEGDLHPVDCIELEGINECSNSDNCVTKYVWMRISDSINDVVDNMMLSQLVTDSEKVQDKAGIQELGYEKTKC